MSTETLQSEIWPVAELVKRQLDGAGVNRIRTLKNVQQEIAQELNTLERNKPVVFLLMPTYSSQANHGAMLAFLSATDNVESHLARMVTTNSLLARGFNQGWTQALAGAEQGKVQYFAMQHSDVVPAKSVGQNIQPDNFWLDKMLEEMWRTGADVLSVVSPIKNDYGLTSVAVDDNPDRWASMRRLTMHEIMKLPETFGIEDLQKVGLAGPTARLVVNTGLMLVDLRNEWMLGFDDTGSARIYFEIDDRVYKEDGRWTYAVIPEDWGFCRKIYAVHPDAKIMATRKIKIGHCGERYFPNDQAWGQWQYDMEVYGMETVQPPQEEATVTSS